MTLGSRAPRYNHWDRSVKRAQALSTLSPRTLLSLNLDHRTLFWQVLDNTITYRYVGVTTSVRTRIRPSRNPALSFACGDDRGPIRNRETQAYA